MLVSKTKNIIVGNGQYIAVLFIKSVMINLQGHRFEVYTLVSEIHDNIFMVMVKDVYEIEGIVHTKDSYLHSLNKSFPFFPMTDVLLKPREKRLIKNYVEA